MAGKQKLALCRRDTTIHVRMNVINYGNIQNYYQLLKEVLDEHNLLNHLEQIYMDKNGDAV